MYLGHVGIALAACRVPPGVPVFWLCVATVFLDLVDVAVDVAGLDNTFTAWSHTLGAASGWAALVGLVGARFFGRRGGLVLGGVALSHLATDLFTSFLWLWPEGPRVGLRLYARPALDFALEAAVIVAGWWLYRGTLSPEARRGPYAWGSLGVLLGLQAAFVALGVARVP